MGEIAGEIADTGDVAWVPSSERLDTDEGEGANAGGDDDDYADLYAEPGEVVEL